MNAERAGAALAWLRSCSLCAVPIVCAIVLVACAPNVEVRPTTLSSSIAPRPKDCEIDWFERSDALPEPYGDLGEIYVGSADVPAKCGEQVVRERLREAACKAGADAAVMLIVRKPDILSFCYRMRARLLKYGEFTPAVLLPSVKREVWSSNTGLPRGLRGHH